MTKTDLIKKVAKVTRTKKEAARTVDAFLDAIREALAKGEEVRLKRFGCFKVKERAARIGRNPKTGEEVKVPAKKVVVFKAGDRLKIDVRTD